MFANNNTYYTFCGFPGKHRSTLFWIASVNSRRGRSISFSLFLLCFCFSIKIQNWKEDKLDAWAYSELFGCSGNFYRAVMMIILVDWWEFCIAMMASTTLNWNASRTTLNVVLFMFSLFTWTKVLLVSAVRRGKFGNEMREWWWGHSERKWEHVGCIQTNKHTLHTEEISHFEFMGCEWYRFFWISLREITSNDFRFYHFLLGLCERVH